MWFEMDDWTEASILILYEIYSCISDNDSYTAHYSDHQINSYSRASIFYYSRFPSPIYANFFTELCCPENIYLVLIVNQLYRIFPRWKNYDISRSYIIYKYILVIAATLN